MRHLLAIFLCAVFGLNSAKAGIAVYSNLLGNSFIFKSMTEIGGTNVPPGLEQPRLFSNPYDTIKFSPATYVVVENNGPDLRSSTNSSTLNLTIEALTSAAIQEFTVSISGAYGMTLYKSSPEGEARVGLSLGLDLTYGSTKVQDFLVPVTQNTNDNTWYGTRTFTAGEFRTIFQQPTLEVQQLIISAKPSVSAEAQWANATSRISYLDLTVVPIPEPSSLHLLWASFALILRNRFSRGNNEKS